MTRARRGLAFATLALAACAAGVAGADVPGPTLKAHVTDLTGTLAAADVAKLEQRLSALEQRKGAQLAVLLVQTTEPETIEQFALKVADQNGLGRKGVDDGALLLVAMKDRRARIDTRYGLEGAIPDAVAKRLITSYLEPHFRQGDYAGGLDETTAALVKLVDGEPLPAPMAAQDSGGGGQPDWFFAIFIGLFVGMFAAGTRLKPVAIRRLGAGGVAAVAAWLVVGGISALAAAAVVAFLLSGARATSGGRYIGPGGWGGGGFGGGSGGFGGGGGGWSGGGGLGGGGGASGGW